MSTTMDEVYHERDQVIALAALLASKCGLSVWLGEHERSDPDWEEAWRHIVYIQLPTGQVSWHIHDTELPLFARIAPGATPWDRHSVESKYRRLEQYVRDADEIP